MRTVRTILAAALLMFPNAGYCHDTWDNGEPVDNWAKKSCCSEADVHRLDPNRVHVVPGGFKLDELPSDKTTLAGPQPQEHIVDKTIPSRRVLPSPDGKWYAFWSNNDEYVYCIYGNLGSV